jgi:hypothetical protein
VLAWVVRRRTYLFHGISYLGPGEPVDAEVYRRIRNRNADILIVREKILASTQP